MWFMRLWISLVKYLQGKKIRTKNRLEATKIHVDDKKIDETFPQKKTLSIRMIYSEAKMIHLFHRSCVK